MAEFYVPRLGEKLYFDKRHRTVWRVNRVVDRDSFLGGRLVSIDAVSPSGIRRYFMIYEDGHSWNRYESSWTPESIVWPERVAGVASDGMW